MVSSAVGCFGGISQILTFYVDYYTAVGYPAAGAQ